MAQLVEAPVIDRGKDSGRVPGKNLGGESIRTSGHLEEMAEFEIQASVKLAYACLGFRVMEERALAKRITPVRYRQGVAERFPRYKQSVPLYTFIGKQLDFDAEFFDGHKSGVDLRNRPTDVPIREQLDDLGIYFTSELLTWGRDQESKEARKAREEAAKVKKTKVAGQAAIKAKADAEAAAQQAEADELEARRLAREASKAEEKAKVEIQVDNQQRVRDEQVLDRIRLDVSRPQHRQGAWPHRDTDQLARPGQGDRTQAQPAGHGQSGWATVTKLQLSYNPEPDIDVLRLIQKAGVHPKTGKPLCTPKIACSNCQLKRAPGRRINALGDKEDQPDPCLGNLPGVVGACCGHGVNQGFIGFEDGKLVYGYLRVTNVPPSWKKENEGAKG